MESLSKAEKRALDLMKKESFRGISKDNVMQLVSILDKVDPEVAKAIILQMPEVVRGVVENEIAYANVLEKGIESCNTSTNSCFQTEDEIVKALQKQPLSKSNITLIRWLRLLRGKRGRIRNIRIWF